jgi:hypothetical protein
VKGNRLNAARRLIISSHIQACADDLAEKQLGMSALQTAAIKAFVPWVEKQYPPKDMAVLKKYGACHSCECARLQSNKKRTSWSCHVYELKPPRQITYPGSGCKVFECDAPAVKKWVAAMDRLSDLKSEIAAKLNSAIRGVHTVEKAIEVLPILREIELALVTERAGVKGTAKQADREASALCAEITKLRKKPVAQKSVEAA